jgi:hypothetical protein
MWSYLTRSFINPLLGYVEDKAGDADTLSTKGQTTLTAAACQKRERENFSHALFALAFFSQRQDRELPGAISRGLLDCPRRV